MTTSITLGMLMVYIAIMMGIGLYTSRKPNPSAILYLAAVM